LNWDAKNPEEIWKDKGSTIVTGLLGTGLAIFAAPNKMTVATQGFAAMKGIYEGVNQSKNIFLDAKKQAKLSGKLLGCALALNFPFET